MAVKESRTLACLPHSNRATYTWESHYELLKDSRHVECLKISVSWGMVETNSFSQWRKQGDNGGGKWVPLSHFFVCREGQVTKKVGKECQRSEERCEFVFLKCFSFTQHEISKLKSPPGSTQLRTCDTRKMGSPPKIHDGEVGCSNFLYFIIHGLFYPTWH